MECSSEPEFVTGDNPEPAMTKHTSFKPIPDRSFKAGPPAGVGTISQDSVKILNWPRFDQSIKTLVVHILVQSINQDVSESCKI